MKNEKLIRGRRKERVCYSVRRRKRAGKSGCAVKGASNVQLVL